MVFTADWSSRAPATSIADYSKCEVRSVIGFLARKRSHSHRNPSSTCPATRTGDVTNRQNVVRPFREGRTSVYDEVTSGRPSVVTDGFVQKVERFVREDRRSTFDEPLMKCARKRKWKRTRNSKISRPNGRRSWRDGVRRRHKKKISALVIKSAWNLMTIMSKNYEIHTFNVM